MKYLTCPYCEQKIKVIHNLDDYIECKNHGDIVVLIWETLNIEISNSNYMIYLYQQERMELFKINKAGLGRYYDDISRDLPFDYSLTPENFEEKVKTYLIFQ